MKKVLLIMVLTLIPVLASAQLLIDEDFSNGIPPTDWTIDSETSNWIQVDEANAGGTSPELAFYYSPIFSGTSRFISPSLDLTDIDTLKLEFNHMVDYYDGSFTLGVATRHDNGDWTSVWEITPSAAVSPEVIAIDVANDDVGSSDFQICWYFSGYSYYINYWFIDDIFLYYPFEHDIRVSKVIVDEQYDPEEDITLAATVVNSGRNSETFDVTCQIAIDESIQYQQTLSNLTFEPNESNDVEFPDFDPNENEFYDVTVYCELSGDLYTSNDTATGSFNTYTTPRDMVVLEIATGTWCSYCPGAAMGAEDMIENEHDVAIVEYHYNDNFQNDNAVTRLNYYSVPGFPTAYFDGIYAIIGGSANSSLYEYYLEAYEERKPINSAFTIEASYDKNGYDFDLDVEVVQVSKNSYDNMVLRVALTESNISYSWGSLSTVEWVERTMIPSDSGTSLDFSSNDTQTISLSFTADSSWDLDECELAIFIQSDDTKEILQGTKIVLSTVGINDDDSALPYVTELGNNYPNPFNPSTNIEFSLKETGNVTLEVFNVLGQKVKTLVDNKLNAGKHSIAWDSRDESGNSVASGAYFYKLSTDDYTDTKKMVLVK